MAGSQCCSSQLMSRIDFLIRSFFGLLKKDSATALSQQLALRLMLGSRWFDRKKRRQASLSNWVP